MKQREKQMARIAAVRALQEKMAEARSMAAAARVYAVDVSIEQAEDARCAAMDDGARALSDGDRGAWVLADSMGAVARSQRVRLEGVRVERAQEAAERFRKLQREQMRREQAEKMQRLTQEAMVRVAGRDAQAQSDDRFLARRHWNAEHRSMKRS